MSLRRKRFNISFAPAQFIEELIKFRFYTWDRLDIHAFVVGPGLGDLTSLSIFVKIKIPCVSGR